MAHSEGGSCSVYEKTIFGFWVYLLTDFVLFATLFSTYAVLRTHTFGGPSSSELFHLPFTLIQTLVFLVSSFTVGMSGVLAHRKDKKGVIVFLTFTFLLGAIFFFLMLYEFSYLIQSGNSWEKSAFLSAFFTLIGTYGIHLFFGLLWIPVLIVSIGREGLEDRSIRRVSCFRMFWQFLYVIWIFIFTIVYLLGTA